MHEAGRALEGDSEADAALNQPLLHVRRHLGGRRHPYRAYEWNRMRHPTRIIVGSEVSTSLFVMNAAVDARRFLYGGG